jgi:hypothetical protein
MNDKNQRLANFRNGIDALESGAAVPMPGRFYVEKDLRAKIGEAVDSLMKWSRLYGMTPCNCDGVHEVESTIYEWLTKGTTVGATVEGIGRYGLRPEITGFKESAS